MNTHFQSVALESLHYVLGPQVWTSSSIEERLGPFYERLGLAQGRLELMTGIQERRFWPTAVLPSTIAAQAAQGLLEKSGGPEIDLIIYSGVCRDQLEPSTASAVHAALKLPARVAFFDLSNACLGFLDACVVAAALIDSGAVRRVLIVAGEDGRPLLERTIDTLNKTELSRAAIKPYFANLTIGSGAVAATLARRDLAPEGSAILRHCVHLSDTEHNALCRGSGNIEGLHMETDSEEMLRLGCQLASRTWDAFKQYTGWTQATPAATICHQVGKQHRDVLYKTLGLDLAKDYSTFKTLGNIGSAALPVALAQALERQHVGPRQPIALLGIGSGLACRMLALNDA